MFSTITECMATAAADTEIQGGAEQCEMWWWLKTTKVDLLLFC